MQYRVKVIYKPDGSSQMESGYLTGQCTDEYNGLHLGWNRVGAFAKQAVLYAILKVEIEVPYTRRAL